MAGGSSRMTDSGKKKARIEIIPLIDVIFFLLATFVLFTLSLSRIQSLPIQLPVAAPPHRPDPNDDMVTLQVSDAGTYYWNREPIMASEIAPRLVRTRLSHRTRAFSSRATTRPASAPPSSPWTRSANPASSRSRLRRRCTPPASNACRANPIPDPCAAIS